MLRGTFIVALMAVTFSSCVVADTPVSAAYSKTIQVNNTPSLYSAVKQANQRGGNTQIIIAKGTYQLNNTLVITGDNIALVSASGQPENTILRGAGMVASRQVKNLIRVSGQHFRFSGLTGEATPNHIIQIVGEDNADFAVIENCILQDAYEQLLKVSHRSDRDMAADHGVIRHCTFGYTRGIGPQYYIGGIDLHLGQNWLIEANQFIGIASPDNRVAEHAIHLWNNSKSNRVIDNVIINSDRGIGFGMGSRGNLGGLIKDNIIYHADNEHPNADAGIILESSPETIVKNNWLIQYHDYPNAIEYRFPSTQNVLIIGNGVNKRIRQKNNASAQISENNKIEDLPAALKHIILKRVPSYYQQMVFDTLFANHN